MVSELDIKFAYILKQLRIHAGYKQMYVANLIGLSSQQEYSKLECGKMPFTKCLLDRICSVFGVSENEFQIKTRDLYAKSINTDFDMKSERKIYFNIAKLIKQEVDIMNIRKVTLFHFKKKIEIKVEFEI